MVQPGSYTVELFISKGLTLRAGGDRGAVRLLASDPSQPAVTIVSNGRVTIRGFTFSYHTTAIRAFKSAKVEIVENVFKPAPLGALDHAIEFSESQGLIKGNEISGANDGIILRKGSTADIEVNTITGNRWGISVIDDARATIARNMIRHNELGGILLWEEGSATITDNDISANIIAGIGVRMRGRAELTRNTIRNNEGTGVVLQDTAWAALRDNRITGNGGCGVSAAPEVTVEGSLNELGGNRQGDLCPPDFPWPRLFRR